MLSFKSFIDLLFILLLGTMVMLTQSVRLGAVDTVVTKLGAGGIAPVRADEIRVVVVRDEELWFEDQAWADPATLADRLDQSDVVLLVTADREVRHHRMMDVWSALRELRLDVKLGALPRAPQQDEE